MNATIAMNRTPRLADNDVWWRLRAVLAMSMSAHKSDESATRADDAQAIAASLGGDHEAFGQLVEKYQAAMAQQMRRFSRQPAVVEELVQDVFVEAFFSLKSYRSTAPLLHWLRKIAVRTGYRYWDRKGREHARTVSLSELNHELERLTNGTALSSIAASDVLGDLLDLLAPRDRLVLTLLYWDGCSVAEAAELAGWTQVMVKVQAHRARKRLKQLLEESRP